MNLDPCPWCGEQPKVNCWTELSRCMSIDPETMHYIPDEYHMCTVSCCWGEYTGQQDDVELNWNWRQRWLSCAPVGYQEDQRN